MGADQSKILQKQLFEIKLAAKQLSKESSKCLKREADAKLKVKQAIQKGDMDSAKVFAQNAIREKQQSLALLRLSSRMEAVAQRVESAIVMGNLTKSMKGVVHGMDSVLQTLDPVKISHIMDQFEKQFDTLDFSTTVMAKEMDRSTGAAMQESDVMTMIQMVADEHGLQVADQLGSAPISAPATKQAAAVEEDDLEARLAALKS